MTAVTWAFIIAYWDLSRRRIPNILTFGAALAALGSLAATGVSPLGSSAVSMAVGCGLALLLTLPGYFTNKLGAGDVKLLLAIALLAGATTTLASFVVGALTAGIAAVAWILLGTRLGLPPAAGKHLPFGAGLAMGFVTAVTAAHLGWLPALLPW